MTLPTSSRRGMYFEEFEVDRRIISHGRTITEADVVNFAGLSGDYNSIHTDAVFADQTPYRQRVAHGMLGMSIASGLADRTGMIEGTALPRLGGGSLALGIKVKNQDDQTVMKGQWVVLVQSKPEDE